MFKGIIKALSGGVVRVVDSSILASGGILVNYKINGLTSSVIDWPENGWYIYSTGNYNDGIIYVSTMNLSNSLFPMASTFMYGDSESNSYNHKSNYKNIKEYNSVGNDVIDRSISPENLSKLKYHGLEFYLGSGDDYVLGSFGADRVHGESGDDELQGDLGNDALIGGDGNDYLDGGIGNDSLNGQNGADTLFGGAGKDIFYFGFLTASKASAGRLDVIEDFVREDDIIDLSSIDARTNVDGNNSFKFIGDSEFSGTSGQLRYVRTNTDTYVHADVDGDEVSEFSIRLLWSMNLKAEYFDL